jgi:hypothetical protein
VTRRILFLACLVLPGLAGALDFGLVLYQRPLFGTPETAGDGFVEYAASVLPWVSVPLGERAEFYASGGLGIRRERLDREDEGRGWGFIPELGRFELSFRPGADLGLELGRLSFSDPLGLVCSGLIDGLGAVWNLAGTRLRAGVFYTGLLYKKSGYILMSNPDLEEYHDGGVYFASRRLVCALAWEAPSLLDTRSQADLGILAQTDLNGGDDTLHSQYLLARWRRSLGRGWYADLGAVLEAEEREGRGGFGCALSLAPFWVPAARPYDRLFFNARFASGNWNRDARSFKPLSAGAQGRVLRARFSALALAELGYTARLFPALEGEAGAAYIFRTDRETYRDPNLDAGSRASALGGELFARLSWAPEFWCGLSAEGGVFLPQPGGAYRARAEPVWRLDTSLTLSF